MSGRILVVRAGALGDVLLALPAVSALRDRFPEKELWAVGYPEVWEVARPLVDRIESIDLPELAGLFSASPSPRLRAWLEGVDLAVAWTVRDPTEALRAAGVSEAIHASPYPPAGVHAAAWLLATLEPPYQEDGLLPPLPVRYPGGIEAKVGTVAPSSPLQHESEVLDWRGQGGPPLGAAPTGTAAQYVPPEVGAIGPGRTDTEVQSLRLVAQETSPHGCCSGTLSSIQLGLTADERRRARVELSRMGLERPAFLHPGAGASWKRWPAENFARLTIALLDRGYDPVLIEGPADREAVAQVQERVGGCLPVVWVRPIRELGALLSQGKVFVGNDSGITHLAAAAGAPTVALFGPTDPTNWRPLGDVRVLRACRACATRQGQIRVCEDPGCMEGIGVEEVLRLLG